MFGIKQYIKNYFQHNVPNLYRIFKYIGPGFIVTVGFIDPGNWATNIQAGSEFGYALLWVVSLSTIMLIILQYNASKLGIVSGQCIAEAVTKHSSPFVGKFFIYSGLIAVVSTIIAEILGGAIALQMIFGLPIKIGAIIIALGASYLIFSNSYNKIENIIISFVSIIALSFLVELMIADVDWLQASYSAITPQANYQSIFIIMGILGAVVMPHNLFLHSEFIQSRQKEDDMKVSIQEHLKLAKYDTIISMIAGWAINSAMIILAAATFFKQGITVTELSQAQDLLKPMLGKTAAGIFALALLFSGIASAITAGMSGGVLFAGLHDEEYNSRDRHTTLGIIVPIILAVILIFFISDPFSGLIYTQVLLSIQLPITILALITLTSSPKIMGIHHNSKTDKLLLWLCALIVIVLNLLLLASFFFG